jgi:hypothetical protein
MKALFLGFASFFVLISLLSSGAFADPRMEINKNFCHFILDPKNTDNEVFMAGCNAQITTIEDVAVQGGNRTDCENVVATGYGELAVVIPQAAIPLKPGQTLKLTSDDSDTPCTMVESNGRAYRSYNWQSTVKIENPTAKGLVKVTYKLFCQEGRQ